MRLSVVFRYIGVVMILLSAMIALSAGVAWQSNDSSLYPLVLSALLTALLGVFPLIFVESTQHISMKEGYMIVVGAWLTACVVTMFPYIIWGGEFSLANAWFESVSGLTTTGASILTDIEALPRGLLFWRMASTWIGGVGVIMFALVILPSVSRSKMTLSSVELSQMAKDNYKYRTQIIVRIILAVYIGLTAATTIALKLAGMNWFDSLTHAMSTMATSGFSTKNASIAYFNSPAIEWIIFTAMILAGTHFGLIFATFTGKANNIFNSEVMRVYMTIIGVAGFVIGCDLFFNGYYDTIMESLRISLFQFVSFFTTTGFATADSEQWSSFAIIILIFASLVCACAGSTTGGMKINRLLIAAKILKNRVAQQQHPNAVLRVRVDGVPQDEDILHGVTTFIVLYLALMFIGAFIGTLFGQDIMTSFTASIACLGNVGPGFGDVGAMDNYSGLPSMYKCVLTLLMLLGRLEIFGLIQLFIIKWWR